MSNPTQWLRGSVAACSLFLATSCYYDTYAGGGYGYGGGYSGGYESYGYVGGGTTFIYTSSDRWFYDPEVYCYYDRYRRCYYDPYLGGYYPTGYCPRPVYGLHHPGGWRPGSRYCPPPSGFRDRRLSSYDNRAELLRRHNFNSVREREVGNDWRNQRLRSAESFRERRADTGSRPDFRGPGGSNAWEGRGPGNNGPFPSSRPDRSWNGNTPGRSPWQGGGGNSPRFPQQGGESRRNWQQPTRPGFNQPVDNGERFFQQEQRRQREWQEEARKAETRQVKGQRIVTGPRPEIDTRRLEPRPDFRPQPQFQPRQEGGPRPQRSESAPRSSRGGEKRDDDGRDFRRGR